MNGSPMNTTGSAYLGGMNNKFTITNHHYERMFKLPSNLNVQMETANMNPSTVFPSLQPSSKETRPEKESLDAFNRKISKAQKALDDCQQQLSECKSEVDRLKRQRPNPTQRPSASSSSMSRSPPVAGNGFFRKV